VRSMDEYRQTLDRIGAGTVSAEFAREILEAAEREIEARSGEFTVTQAVELSGRSRSWYERRLPDLEESGLARKVGAVWLLKAAAIPTRRADDDGFDPLMTPEEIANRMAAA
jgi:hypothetical protein